MVKTLIGEISTQRERFTFPWAIHFEISAALLLETSAAGQALSVCLSQAGTICLLLRRFSDWLDYEFIGSKANIFNELVKIVSDVALCWNLECSLLSVERWRSEIL